MEHFQDLDGFTIGIIVLGVITFLWVVHIAKMMYRETRKNWNLLDEAE